MLEPDKIGHRTNKNGQVHLSFVGGRWDKHNRVREGPSGEVKFIETRVMERLWKTGERDGAEGRAAGARALRLEQVGPFYGTEEAWCPLEL